MKRSGAIVTALTPAPTSHWFHAQNIAEKHNSDAAKLDKVLLEGEKTTPRHKIDSGTRKLVLA
jgi:hypothetical protein